jgi:hypothetical protein
VLDLAARVDDDAAAAGERVACAPRPAQQRDLRERLGVQRRRCQRGGAQQAGPRRLAGRRVEQVVGAAAVAGLPCATDDRRGRDGAIGDDQAGGGALAQRMRDLDRARRTDAEVAAAVDDPRAEAGEVAGDEVGDVALAGAAEVKPQARRPRDRPAFVVVTDAEPAPRRVGRGGTPAAGRQRRRRVR